MHHTSVGGIRLIFTCCVSVLVLTSLYVGSSV